jgi:pimeloyl-ACP methyl ester carboxylesterase
LAVAYNDPVIEAILTHYGPVLDYGYRVIANDRRGHGRSTQTAEGHGMDTYADDAAEVVKKLGLKNSIHIGHSMGGGGVARYVARHGKGEVAKAQRHSTDLHEIRTQP